MAGSLGALERNAPIGRLAIGAPVLAGLALSLLVLLAHAWHYAFLTDDAFISFRYARNWSEGAGLVFNPGFERVEGYTDFLWVALLAAGARLGIAPESLAIPLSLSCTVGLWLAVAWFGAISAPQRRRAVAVLLPPWLLAITPSVAVWSTSGLETRLFELLITAGAFRLLVEDARLQSGASTPLPAAAVLFALGTLTRPDGLLLAACALGTVALLRWRVVRARLPWLIRSGSVYALLVGGHLLFRFGYYGEWLPNTWYAKVDGRTWWALGWPYLEAFALEYAVYLWVPLLVAGVAAHRRRRTLVVPLVFGAICLPHALYVASIGGDHFEYRPLDLYFGFAFVLVAHGAADWMRGRAATWATAAYLALFVAIAAELPHRAHADYPTEFRHGFPGDFAVDPVHAAYLDPTRNVVHKLPGLRALAARHRALVRQLASHFAALRREEHVLFLETVETEGRALRALVESGVLPADTYIGICCVGAIPYFSRLRTLDRIGLTDATVARGALLQPNLVAHGKSAPRSYGRRRGVDFWSIDPVHLLLDGRDPNFPQGMVQLHTLGLDAWFARIDEHHYLVAELLQGGEAARRRFPRLSLRSTRDPAAIRELMQEVGAPPPAPADAG